MAPAAGSRVRLSTDALSEELGDELFILDLQRQRYYSLDAVGARVWALLGEHGDIARTIGQVVVEYDVDPDTAQADVSNLVSRLAAEGLIILD
jgi:hypothetical protein